jgi:hypothetical protein
MKKLSISLFLVLITVLLLAAGCQPVSLNTQRATATAFAVDYMEKAMAAAETGALSLCNIDFKAGKSAYVEAICSASTQAGCAFFTRQVNGGWEDLDRAYTSEKLICESGTTRLLDEGLQFGMRTQYWQVNLNGTAGFGANDMNREYFVQVAEENSQWKLNRVLTSDEVAFYLTIEAMAGE